MPRRLLLLLATVSLLAGLLPTAATADAAASAEAAAVSSANIAHVANLRHSRVVEGEITPLAPSAAQNGTDIEFADIPVTTTGADGVPVTTTRQFALAGTYSHGLQIVDVTDPANPVTTGIYDCGISQGDVQVFTRDGRTYATYTADNGYAVRKASACVREARTLGLQANSDPGHGTYIADITDPANPETVSFYGNPAGSHNQTVAPGGMYLYNSNSDIGAVDGRMDPLDQTGRIEVVDISDFGAPKEVTRLALQTGADSHDITFSPDGKRAYTAALTHTLVLDTTNLAAPKVIGRILDPAVNIHHQADPVTLTDATTGQTGTFLVVSDELAGAAGNGVCPGGGLHIYNITGALEAAPVKVGFWAIPDIRPATGNLTCTSHVLRLHPEQALMTIAWYDAGVHVVDISGLVGVAVGSSATGNLGVGMKELAYYAFDDADTWSVKTNRIEEDGSFYLFGNDMARGLDVYRYTATAPASTQLGTWLTPEEALAAAKARGLRSVGGENTPFCLLKRV